MLLTYFSPYCTRFKFAVARLELANQVPEAVKAALKDGLFGVLVALKGWPRG